METQINNITTLEEFSTFCNNLQQQIVTNGLPLEPFLPQLVQKRIDIEQSLLITENKPIRKQKKISLRLVKKNEFVSN